MSISAMLGGPPPAREPAAPPPYPPAPSVSGASYNQPMHASPRMHTTAAPEYAPFRRPQTPDRHRMYDSRDTRDARDPRDTRDPREMRDLREPRDLREMRDPREMRDLRDPRAPPAGSPPGAYANSTPEVQRYGTPHAYSQRGPPLTAAEQAREQSRMPLGAVPPRPTSQPKSFPGVPPPRPMEMGRAPPNEMYGHREDMRPSEEYNPERPIMKYEEPRYMSMSERERQEREHQEREMELRERERRGRPMMGGDIGRQPPMHQPEYGRPMDQRAPYGRPPDPRDQAQQHWSRPGFDPARAPYDPAGHLPRHHEFPMTTAPPYNGYQAYAPGSGDRYMSHQPHHHSIPPPRQGSAQAFESPERQRMNLSHLDRTQQPPHHQPRNREEPLVPPPSVAYGAVGHMPGYDSPRNRSIDELGAPSGQQRNLLGVQEMNRKGRISPLPQAVQGAQPQHAGPAGEPGIKSEFGRMFSGLGTGVGTISSPVPTGAQLPFTGTGLMRREDSDGIPPPEAVADPGPKAGTGRGKRRKLKEEEPRNDDDSTGRQTPVGGRAKKAKTHSHHHHQ